MRCRGQGLITWHTLTTINYCKPGRDFFHIVLNRNQRQHIIKPLLEANISASKMIDWYCFKYQLRGLLTCKNQHIRVQMV